MAQLAAEALDAPGRYFDYAAMLDRPAIVGSERNPPRAAGNAWAVAAVVAHAERRQRAQAVVVGAVIARPERDRLGRPRFDQHLPRIVEDLQLLVAGEIAQVLPNALAQRIGRAGKAKPFGVGMQLDIVPTLEDRLDDIGDRLDAPHQRRHRIDEEHGPVPEALEHVHLVENAHLLAVRRAADDRARETVGAASHVQRADHPRGVLGIDRDIDTRHRAREPTGRRLRRRLPCREADQMPPWV